MHCINVIHPKQTFSQSNKHFSNPKIKKVVDENQSFQSKSKIKSLCLKLKKVEDTVKAKFSLT